MKCSYFVNNVVSLSTNVTFLNERRNKVFGFFEGEGEGDRGVKCFDM